MKTIELYQTSLILYSAKEWQNCKDTDGGMLGGYNSNYGEWNIHMLLNQKELEKVYFNLFGKPLPPHIKWEEILVHEYVHYLQHAKGYWEEMIPLGLGAIPLTKKFKGIYHSSKWAIEAEAFWVQKHPHLIKWKPPNI